MLKTNYLVVIVGLLALLMISHLHFPSFKSRHGIIPVFLIIPVFIFSAGVYALVAHVPLALTMVSAYICSALIIEVLMFSAKRLF